MIQDKKNSFVRDSNMELARIVAMSMIVVWHFIVHGLWGADRYVKYSLSGMLHFDQYAQWLIGSLCVVGVNLFVLISGYFRIRIKWRSLVQYYLMCIFYGILVLLISSGTNHVGIREILRMLLISNTPNWFFPAYFILMLVSPILNSAIDNIGAGQLRVVILFLIFLTCITGWLLQNGNDNGYNAYQMLTVYIIGGYVSREKAFEQINGKFCLFLYFVLCLMSFASMIVLYYMLDKDNLAMFNYNCLFVLLASVSLFLFFRSLSFRSKVVNVIATTVVAALFVQEAVSVWLYGFIHESYMSDGFTLHLLLYLVFFFLAIFIIAFVMESVRKFLMKPLVNRIASFMDSALPLPFNH